MTEAISAAPNPVGRKHRILWGVAGICVSLLAITTALGFWANSQQFENLVRRRVAQQLEAATGGKVEIASFHWHLFDLEAEAGGVVIHGDEQANEAPYAKIDHMRVRFSVLNIWSPHFLLRDLEISHPQLHLIVYPDGTTNQPHPQKPRKASTSALDTLFKAKAGHVTVDQGWFDLDNRAASLDFQDRYQPLDFQADHVSLLVQYAAAAGKNPESYHIEIGARDLDLARGGTARASSPPVHGMLQAKVDLTRDAAYLRSFTVTAHTRWQRDRTLEVTGALFNFAHPRWQATTKGELDMRLLNPVLGYPFAPEGIAHLDLSSGGQAGEFHIDGAIHAERASYIGTGVVARGVDLNARVHADPMELRITSIVARLEQGGAIEGEVLLSNWLPPAAPQAVVQASTAAKPLPPGSTLRKKLGGRFRAQAPPPPVVQVPPHSVLVKRPEVDIPVDGKVIANFKDVSLDTILDMVSRPPFHRLGIATLLNGEAIALWNRGDTNSLSVSSKLGLTPSTRLVAGETPAQGAIDATYTQRDGAVEVRTLDLRMAASQLQAHGRLGAYPITSPTALSVDFHSGNLGEFDTVFRALGVQRNGKSGVAALPIALRGQADFHGAWGSSLASPRLQGNLAITQLTLELPRSSHSKNANAQFVSWDSIEASGSYDAEHIAIVHGQLHRGASQILIDGTLDAAPSASMNARARQARHEIMRGDEKPGFDDAAQLHAHIRAENVPTNELLPLAGLDLPVNGTLDAQLQTDGPLRALGGSGWVQLNNGVVYGEPVSKIRAQGSFANQLLKLSSVAVNTRAGSASGSGSYDLRSGSFQAEARGSGIDISKIERLRSSGEAISGKLGFSISTSGTRTEPRLDGHATLSGTVVSGQPLGTIDLAAHTTNHALTYTGTTRLDSAELNLHGQTELRGDYPSEAKLEFSHFNIAALFKLAHMDGISASSALAGTATIAGPLAHRDQLHGDLRLRQLAVVIAGVHLQSQSGLHASLDRGHVYLDPLHITGDETDIHAQAGLELNGNRRIDLSTNGSVNLKLAQTLDPDVTAGGTSLFQIEAHGPLSNPGFQGRVEFRNGSMAFGDLPNGLSQLQGVLEFNQNRLEVRSLTAMTGGGQLSVGGYLAYQRGVYADLSVTGRGVRIRYPQGVSSLADATLRLQGTQSSLLLSGRIFLTRFTVSPDLDFATLAAQANVVRPVAPPNAPSNHVRLDLHIQSSPQLNFQNAYAKLAGNVDLRVRGTLASPSLLGRVSITEGNAVIAGTRYELQRGEVNFTNPVRIQPSIDLNATARVEDYDITLSLHGTPDKMSVSYRSDPPLPETDVVALLALGRTQSEQGLYTQQQHQSVGTPSTDALLGGALNATVSSRVQKLFGAGSVKVDPSYLGALGNSTTRITVEEQLGKNVTLIYATNVDTTAQQLLQAEIAINRHVSLMVARDESGVFSMVVKATRRYR